MEFVLCFFVPRIDYLDTHFNSVHELQTALLNDGGEDANHNATQRKKDYMGNVPLSQFVCACFIVYLLFCTLVFGCCIAFV